MNHLAWATGNQSQVLWSPSSQQIIRPSDLRIKEHQLTPHRGSYHSSMGLIQIFTQTPVILKLAYTQLRTDPFPRRSGCLPRSAAFPATYLLGNVYLTVFLYGLFPWQALNSMTCRRLSTPAYVLCIHVACICWLSKQAAAHDQGR